MCRFLILTIFVHFLPTYPWHLCLIVCIEASRNINHFREIVFGEHKIGPDPDCGRDNNGRRICFPKKIVRTVDKSFVHESYQLKPQGLGRSKILASSAIFI